MNNKKMIFMIISIQIVAIIFLSIKIVYKEDKILGEVTTNTINKEKIEYTSEKLKYFFEPKANSTQSSMEYHPLEIEYSINSDSLHERYDYDIEKDPKVFRIITLGDSFTFGLFMKLKDNWTEILEDTFNEQMQCENIQKIEVINLGVYGYDIQYAVERYKLRGQKYNPDLIMWFIKADDVFQINEILLEKERYYAQQISESQRNEFISKGEFYPSWKKAMQDIYDIYGPEKLKNNQIKFLKEFDSLYYGKTLIIGFDREAKEVKDLLNEYTYNDPDKYLLDTLPNAVTHPDLYIPQDGHPNEKGHKVIAEEVYNYVNNNNIIPCN